MGITDKLQQEAQEKGGGAADQGLEKAGQELDEKTGGKYSDQINSGVDKAKGAAGQKFGQPDAAGNGNGQGQQPDQQSQPADQGQQADSNQQADQPPQGS
ncbi:MAG TPA: antitoxin [Actinocrinis sp.]|jgi:hypothetical protein